MPRPSRNDVRASAVAFAHEWQDETRERGEAQTFWTEFLEVFGVQRRRVRAAFERHARRGSTGGAGFIDLLWPGMLLRSILGTAVEDGLIPTNPCTIKGAGVERATVRAIPTVAQAHQLAHAIEPRLRCLVLVAAFIGLRKSELLGLRRRDVGVEHLTAFVAGTPEELLDLGLDRGLHHQPHRQPGHILKT